ncbi:M56 family metallopeptidase [Glaciecola sp. MF2-115]|uniref:M56 family metallopeptidase n=1 Tax=Glaciecola sp. MF2-115 TaxID=3384827 RepID=UPI0039A0F829
MADYFVTNFILSFIAFLVLVLLKNSPARIRFYVALTALIAWLIPWHLVSTITIVSDAIRPIDIDTIIPLFWLENTGALQTESNLISVAQSENSVIDTIKNVIQALVADISVLLFVFAAGMVLFIKDIVNYRTQLQLWTKHSHQDNSLWHNNALKSHGVPIRLLNNCGVAMSTGFTKPIVWLNPSYQNDAKTRTILTHELNHILQNDTMWMWCLAFMQRLFWWNPVVRTLSKVAREQIELSCDEKCNEQLDGDYPRDLAEIFLTEVKSSNNHLATVTIKNSKNFNIKRLQTLSKEHQMKSKYLVVLFIALGMSSFVAATVSYQENTPANKAIKIDSEQNHRAKNALYRDDEMYNGLIDKLLLAAQNAKSEEPETIDGVLQALTEWNLTRKTHPNNQLERSLGIMGFTITAYLLDKRGRFDEIPKTYDDIFPDRPIEKELFLKHHVALAYIKMGMPEKATDLMVDVAQRQPKPKDGTLLLIAHAQLASANYSAVIANVDKILSVSENQNVKIEALNLKREAYIQQADSEKVTEVNGILKDSYGIVGGKPDLPTLGTPVLQYLPEV